MKKFYFFILIILSGLSSAIAYDGYEVSFDQAADAYRLTFSLDDISISETTVDGQVFSIIGFEGSVFTMKAGFARLPFIHAAVMLEADNNVRLEVSGTEYVEYQLSHPLLPSRGVIYRDQDPSEVPYLIDPKSMTDTWYPGNLAENTAPYILRDIRGTNIYVYPFQYNALKNTLRVYTSVEVTLADHPSAPVNPLPNEHPTVEYEMDQLYASIFVNYLQNRDELTIGEMGDILVICTERDEAAMDPYIQWKKEKGYNVSKEVVAAGTNVNSLVQDAYTNNNDLLYVQLVGDWADIKCNTLSGGSPMDPQVGCVAGADEVPDISVGRFSASSPADVTVQVDKVITFEKFPQAGAGWYGTATGIGSQEGPGDDNEKDYEHLDVIFNDKLDPFTYEAYNPIYEPSGSIADVNAAVNGGTSVINYCGHGSPTSWGTTGFSNSNVASLSNGDLTPWIVSVACNNGDFHTGTCFAEAWQRKSGGGSVMFLGASISQPWDPPMRGQDYFADIFTGGYDYAAHPGQNGISTTEGRTTLGTIVFNGLVLMTTESNGPSDWETAKTWNLFGDPSMQARSDVPAELLLSNELVMVGIPFETNITAGGSPVAAAMVTLSQDENYFTGITDAAGHVSITHGLVPGDALLVVTGFNTETIYQTITVVPSAGAYVIYASHDVNDASGNGDGLLDYGESALLTVALTNVGSDDASNVNVILSTTDEYVTITDGEEDFGNILAGATVEMEDCFAIEVAPDIPDGHMILFTLESTGEETWNSTFADYGHAPVLLYSNYSIDDAAGNGNGKLDPGETATLTITLGNEGSSDAFEVDGVLSSLSEFVTVEEVLMNYGTIPAGETAEQLYILTALEDTPAGHTAAFSIAITALQGIYGEGEFSLVVGQIPVLVIDMDENNNSAEEMMTCLENLSVAAEMVEGWPDDMNLYSSVFVCLGIYPSNNVLSQSQGQELVNYLNAGGNLYMEGGDTWFYDQPTPVHSMFNIQGLEDGSDDLGVILGQAGTFTEGMEFNYSGDNSWVDHIAPLGEAFTIFKNQSPSYINAVAYDEGTYRTIGSSFEFGGLTGTNTSTDYLMHQYLDFFGIDAIWVGVPEGIRNGINMGEAYPNPFTNETSINCTLPVDMHLSIDIYNISGQKVNSLVDRVFTAGTHTVTWNARAEGMPEGIYLIRVQTKDDTIVRKVILMH
jgi:hypothetical protein